MNRTEIGTAARNLALDYLDALRGLRATSPNCEPAKLASWAEYNGRTTRWMADAKGGDQALARWMKGVKWATVERRKEQVIEAACAHLLYLARLQPETLELLVWATGLRAVQ